MQSPQNVTAMSFRNFDDKVTIESFNHFPAKNNC
jgi:hypothetical protein